MHDFFQWFWQLDIKLRPFKQSFIHDIYMVEKHVSNYFCVIGGSCSSSWVGLKRQNMALNPFARDQMAEWNNFEDFDGTKHFLDRAETRREWGPFKVGRHWGRHGNLRGPYAGRHAEFQRSHGTIGKYPFTSDRSCAVSASALSRRKEQAVVGPEVAATQEETVVETVQLPSPVEKMLVTQPIKDQFRVAALLVDHLARVFPGDCAGFLWVKIKTEWFDQISMKVTNTQLGSDDGFGVGVCDTFNLGGLLRPICEQRWAASACMGCFGPLTHGWSKNRLWTELLLLRLSRDGPLLALQKKRWEREKFTQ